MVTRGGKAVRPLLREAIRRYWAVTLVGGLTVTVLVALLVAGMTSATAFEPYNPDWDGTSEFRNDVADDSDVESEIATDTTQYDESDPNATVAFVLTPDEPYAWTDADRVQAFVENGGTLVVLENFGEHGEGLLASVGADARLDGRLVLDERENYRGPAMPLATETASHTRTDDIEQLALNYGTAIEPGNATVLVATSEYGYLAANATDPPDRADELGTYPVATTQDIGDGTVVAIGDPSIATNAMYDEQDNAQFLENQYAGADRVIFDRSHAPDPPPLAAAILAIRTTPALQFLIGLAGIAGSAAVATLRLSSALAAVRRALPVDTDTEASAGRAKAEPSDEELIAALRRQHPEWDADHVRRVVTARKQARKNRRDER